MTTSKSSIIQSLQDENLLLYSAINSSITGVIITDNRLPDNPIIYCNKAFEELSGYTREEIIGRNCRFLQREDRSQEERAILRSAVANQEHCKVEIRNYQKGGKLFINELTISPVRTDDGDVTHFIGIQNDVSDRKKLETQLKTERAQLEETVKYRTAELEDIKEFQASIIETVREGLLVLDKNYVVLSANSHFYRTFKVGVTETLNHSLFELGNGQWDIPELRDLLLNIIPHNNPFEDFQVSHVFPHLGQRTMILNGRQIEYEGMHKDRILLAIEDATERIEADIRKDDFLSLASHELKTPITSIKGYLQIAKRMIPDSSGKLSEIFNKVLKQVDHLTDLIVNLLDISKIKAGKIDVNKKEFDFQTMVDEAIETMRQTQDKHAINLHGKIDLRFTGDQIRLEQVMTNLISNAIKYSPDSDKIDIHIGVMANVVKVTVVDYGIGIDPHDLSKVFDRFFRVNGVHLQYPGMGLGLYFCNQIVKLHDGHLWVDSEIDHGSSFSFTLPL